MFLASTGRHRPKEKLLREAAAVVLEVCLPSDVQNDAGRDRNEVERTTRPERGGGRAGRGERAYPESAGCCGRSAK